MSENQQPPAASSSRLSSFALWGLCLLLLLAVAYLLTTQKQLTQALNQQQQQVTSAQRLLQQAAKNINQQQAVIVTTQEGLAQNKNQLAQLSQYFQLSHEARLTLKSVQHILKLANLKLNYAKDTPSAVYLLQQADRQLAKFDSPQIKPVRTAIVNDMLSLKAAKTPDIEGTFLILEALKQQIPDLPQAEHQKKLSPTPNKEIKDDTAATSHWQNALEQSLAEIKSLIRIREHRTPIKPLLTEQQAIHVLENLRLIYQTAQLALLQGQQQIFLQSINDAQQWLKTYFNQSNELYLNHLQTLDDLHKVKLNTQTTDLHQSLQAIDNLLAES